MKYYQAYKKLELDELFEIQGAEFKHLKVNRMLKPAQQVNILSSDKLLYNCQIVQFSKESAQLKVLAEHSLPQKNTSLHLYLSLIKPKPLEWAIIKATELNVASINLMQTDYSNYNIKQLQTKRDRLIKLISESAKQCGRLNIPNLHFYSNLAEALQEITNNSQIPIVFDSNSKCSIANYQYQPNLSLLIGPEGGFSAAERASNSLNEARLDDLTLRAETAGIAALAYFSFLSLRD